MTKKTKVDWPKKILSFYKKNRLPDKTIKIAFCQNKGGVGKTSTTQNMSWIFSQIGKTLVIDMDAQANLTIANGIYEPDLFLQNVLDDPSTINQAIVELSENLYLLPNWINFDQWKYDSNSKRNVQYFLGLALKELEQKFQFVLIDCPPAIDLPFEIALNASEYIFINMDSQRFSLDGLENILSRIDKIIQEDSKFMKNLDLKILGLGCTRYFWRIALSKQIIAMAKNNYSDRLYVFESLVRDLAPIPESQALEKSVFEYDPNSDSANEYFELWKEMVKKI